jgi:hypothetical protein
MSEQRDPVVPEGWSILSVKYHHDFGYWGLWALHVLSSLMPGVNPTPPGADASYSLRRNADGATQTVRLSGDHAPDALARALRLIEAGGEAQR